MNSRPEQSDVVVIGGGPAGISAAIWCAELGLTVSIIEENVEFGGQLLNTFNPITNYPGVKTAHGKELRDRFLENLDKKLIGCLLGERVISADLERMTLTLAGGTSISGRSIIIASGVRRRRLDIPGEVEFAGLGILESGTASRNEVSGQTVVIVGGGDAALENALILSEPAGHVFLVHRGDRFSARPEFVRQVTRKKNIEVLFDTRVTAVMGKASLEGVRLETTDANMPRALMTSRLLIRIGTVPNTELFRGQIELDRRGYVVTDRRCLTSLEGICGIGDVASPDSPTIATAAGQGATAAKFIRSLLSDL